jgi:hypothetical protein
MIPYSRLVFVAASHSLEDVPSGVGSALSADYLTAWTSVWDPRLLAAFGTVPEWRRSDSSGLDLEDSLLCCPDVSHAKMDQPLEERLRSGRNLLVPTGRRTRSQVVSSLLTAFGERLRDATTSVTNTSEASWHAVEDHACPFLEDFYAFGYALLQVQCIARKLRYSFNMDWMVVGDQMLHAARASVKQDADETDRWLAAAFDSLSQERDRYCSQRGHLLDVVLLANTTLGSRLTQALQSDRPLTLHATTQLLDRLKQSNPEAWNILMQRILDETACLAGGLVQEPSGAWWTEDMFIHEMHRARAAYDTLGIPPAAVWMQFTPTIANGLASIGRQFGLQGAIIAALGGGAIPKKEHAKVRWQSAGDRGGLDCILGHVYDAANGESLLHFGNEMAKQLDYHQVPTMVMAHWPNATSEAFQDLICASRRTPALGAWTHAQRYFATTSQPYWSDQFGFHDFHPVLPSATADIHDYHLRLIHGLRVSHSIEQLASLLRLWCWVPGRSDVPTRAGETHPLMSKLEQLRERLYHQISDPSELEQEIDGLTREIVDDLRLRVHSDDDDIVINGTSHTKRVFLEDYPRRIDPHSSTRIALATSDDAVSQCVIDVPSFGFAKFRSSPSVHENSGSLVPVSDRDPKTKSSWLGQIFGSRPAIAMEDGTLANEFMEIQIDPSKGHLRSLYVVNKRGNRLSGQVSWVAQPIQIRNALDDQSFQSVNNASMRVIHTSKTRGSIEVVGQLSTGKCVIRYTLWHGARWLDIDVRGDGVDGHVGFPVWRMVWPSEAANLVAWSQGAKGKLPLPLQSPVELIEIDDAEHRIEFATQGLSMHRRVGSNGLASSLPVRPDGRFHVRFSLGIDWPRAWETAIDRFVPDWVSHSPSKRNDQPSTRPPDTGAWLAQCSASNLSFRWIAPEPKLSVEGPATPSVDGEKAGDAISTEHSLEADACCWIVETAGKSGMARLACHRQIEKAWRVDFRGLEYDKLKVENGELVIPFQAWERSRIALCFEKEKP